MPFKCPCAADCPAEQEFWTQKNTFVAHWAEGHLTAAQVDYLLNRLIDGHDGSSNCPQCQVKNKFKNRAKLLGHVCHKHCNEAQLVWIEQAFMPAQKGNEIVDKMEVDAVAEEVNAKMGASKVINLSALRGIKKQATADENADGYSSEASNSSRRSASAATPFNPFAAKSATLKNKRVMDMLNKKLESLKNTYDADFHEMFPSVEDYFSSFPNGSSIDYVKHLQEMANFIDTNFIANEEEDEEDAEVAALEAELAATTVEPKINAGFWTAAGKKGKKKNFKK